MRIAIWSHIVIIFLSWSCQVDGYAAGGAASTCIEGSTPHHSHRDPQTSIPPYFIITDKQEIRAGDIVKVTLQAKFAEEPFLGFQLAATWANGYTEELPGEFINISSNTVGIPWYYDADQNVYSCVTHGDPMPKTKLEFSWKAPSQLKGDIIFRAGFVKTYEIFWGSVLSAVIKSIGATEEQSYAGQEYELHDIQLDECGKSKGCFLYPDGCDDEECDLAVSWQYNQPKEEFLFEILGKTDAYVAIGWSEDLLMGDDETIHCVADGGHMSLHYGYSPEYYNHRHQTHNMSDVEVQRRDGRVQCRFRKYAKDWLIPFPGVPRREFDMRQRRFLQVAWGENYRGTTVPQAHHDLPLISKSKIDFTGVYIVRGRTFPIKVSIHACFGILGYLLFTSIAMMLARHFKGDISRMMCGLPLWLQLHRAILTIAVSIIIVSVVLIFVQLKRWTDVALTHAVLGLVSVGLMLVQGILGLIRPKPESSIRPLFNWGHSIFAVVAYVLAVVCIFFGVNIQYMQWDFQRPMFIILGVWVGFQLLFEIILTMAERIHVDISTRAKKSAHRSPKADDDKQTFEVDDNKQKNSKPGSSCLKVVVFLVYCLIQIALAVAASYYIFIY